MRAAHCVSASTGPALPAMNGHGVDFLVYSPFMLVYNYCTICMDAIGASSSTAAATVVVHVAP